MGMKMAHPMLRAEPGHGDRLLGFVGRRIEQKRQRSWSPGTRSSGVDAQERQEEFALDERGT